MNNDERRSVGLRPGMVVIGLAAMLAVIVAITYTTTVSAQGTTTGCSVNSMGTIASNDRETEVAEWKTTCASQNRTRTYARFYSFTVRQTSEVRIDLRSTDARKDDTYLYLISGSAKTGTVLEEDDNDGEGRDSHISRQLTAGTYTIEATTRDARRTGGFTLSVAVNKPSASVDDASVFVRQPVTLTATPPAAKGSVSGYQWQRWTGSRWLNVGSRSSLLTRDVSYSAPGTHAFRVMATYRAGGTGTSVPVSAKWVKVANAVYSPLSPDPGDSVTLKVDNDGAPSGTTYQWQRRNGNRWVNEGSASSSTTKSVSYSAIVTHQFRVQAKYTVNGASVSDVSNVLHVTWGEARLVGNIVKDLDIALFGGAPAAGGFSGQATTQGNPDLVSAQTKFVECVNDEMENGTEFTTYYGVLMAYTGSVAVAADKCEGKVRIHSTYSTAVKTELGKLAKVKTVFNDYIIAPRGREFVAGLVSSGLMHLFGATVATDIEIPAGTGMDCVPTSTPSTLQKKLDALNCLVFATPHNFWVNTTKADATTLKRRAPWIGTGDWQCDAVFDGPLPTCRKHDVGFHSLQKFSGSDSTEILDRTWNPRNKALADAKFWADIMEYGCLGSDDFEVWVCGLGDVARRAAAEGYFTGVARWNNKDWPVTTEDLDHARTIHSVPITTTSGTSSVSTHAYVDCEDKMPTIEDVSVKRSSDDDDFIVSWDHVDGCVDDIAMDRIDAWMAIEFDNGEIGSANRYNLKGTATKATFDLSAWQDLEPNGGLFEVYMYPENREYGGEAYIYTFAIDEVK